jgi:4-hydroxy-4-methyl-2-oxoglutarate aldolase
MRHRPCVIRTVARADAEVAARLAAAGVASVHEAQGRSGLLDPTLRPILPDIRIAGPAVTAHCHPGDNLMVHLAVETCRPGDVLVVAMASANSDGMLGELLATSLRARGVIGVVIDAGVRDVAVLRAMRFPVWSRAISAQGTTKNAAGSVNVPVVCAGQLVRPGDVMVADDDGVVCVPAEAAIGVAERAEQRSANEATTREKLAKGELSVDLLGLRAVAARLGIAYDDGPSVDPLNG